MSTTPAPVRVDVATLQGSDASMQDRVFVTGNAVILLDGATDPDATEQDGGWIADQLGQYLVNALADKPDLDLADALADAIRSTAERHGLSPGAAPSTTVTIARWSDEVIDVLVLGDSPAVISAMDGSIQVLDDVRLKELPDRDQFGAPPIDNSAALERSRNLVAYERSLRNRLGGYWIAEANPSAAEHAITASARRATTRLILLVSDGVADGINNYKKPRTWLDALAVATSSARALVLAVQSAEEGDRNRTRWPRAKVHDDKSAAVIEFGGLSSSHRL